jgi:hypothetical protein
MLMNASLILGSFTLRRMEDISFWISSLILPLLYFAIFTAFPIGYFSEKNGFPAKHGKAVWKSNL